MHSNPDNKTKKIIHVDMDCFYAAIEIRDNPMLQDKPVAVGGLAEQRGVLCTCNYIARRYGVHSAMATATAQRLCPDLILLPVNMAKYREVSRRIQKVFTDYTELVEPLALDEAYLDVSSSTDYHGSATLIAKAIRERIWEEEHLTASAGVASNKFLAKIASGWQKPNGLFVIAPGEVEQFIKTLPVNKLFGVGKVTAEKLHHLNIQTCADLQKFSLAELSQQFGKLGQHLYEQCRGQDHRNVNPNRIRKSLSVETTFPHDISGYEICIPIINDLFQKLMRRIQDHAPNRNIKNQYIKIKLGNFKLFSAEIASNQVNLDCYVGLFKALYQEEMGTIRLIGLGVHFQDVPQEQFLQQSLFSDI